MDEATNALDFATQQTIISNIRREIPELPCVVVSHRLDMQDNFDRCYMMKHGQLVVP
jgi:ABC-type bacteriocin/lantibiotic exporter with double-glycine peptidase domain